MPRSRVLALILAGGEGSRLDVLTERRAKPAMPFAGVYRLIDFPLSNCAHSAISDVWVMEQYRPHSLNDHLANGRPWDLDRSHGGLRVLPPYVARDDEGGFAQGNADAIFRQRQFIREWDPDLLLVLSTDHIYTLDYRDVLDHHRQTGADVTLVTTRVDWTDAGRFGVVEIGDDDCVTGFQYKPDQPRSDTVTTEVFLYDAPKLLDTLEQLAADQATDDDEPALQDFGDELLPQLVAEGSAYAFALDGYWRDVGTPDSYWTAHMDLLRPDPPLHLDDPAWPILTPGDQRLPARLFASARVDDGLISPGCAVRGTVIRSVLAPGVIIEEGATVRDSVLLQEARVEAGATIDRAIIDARVRVGTGARVGEAGEGGVESAEELVLVGMDATIPAGARVPAGARTGVGETASAAARRGS